MQIQKSVETNQVVDIVQVQNFDLNQSILSQAPPGDDALGNDLQEMQENEFQEAEALNYVGTANDADVNDGYFQAVSSPVRTSSR